MNSFEFLALGATLFACVYRVEMGRRLRRFFSHAKPVQADTTFPPVTLFRPMKPGVPKLQQKLRALRKALRPGDQMLLGVSDDETERLCREIAGVDVVRCDELLAINPKISKLLAMTPHATYDHWILMDAETIADRQSLDRARDEWLSSDVVTMGYRFTRPENLWAALDEAPLMLTLWPGLMAARPRFTLGACTAVRRADVELVGGWRTFGNHLAEDHALGAALAEAGKTIRLSRSVVLLDEEPMTFLKYAKHQLRVNASYRVCAPWGYLGIVLTHGPSWSLALALCAPEAWWRWGVFFIALFITLTNVPPLRTRSIPWLSVFAETIFWFAGFFVIRVQWAGKSYRLQRNGTIQPTL